VGVDGDGANDRVEAFPACVSDGIGQMARQISRPDEVLHCTPNPHCLKDGKRCTTQTPGALCGRSPGTIRQQRPRPHRDCEPRAANY